MTNGAGGGKHGQPHGPQKPPRDSKESAAKKTVAAVGSTQGKNRADAATRTN